MFSRCFSKLPVIIPVGFQWFAHHRSYWCGVPVYSRHDSIWFMGSVFHQNVHKLCHVLGIAWGIRPSDLLICLTPDIWTTPLGMSRFITLKHQTKCLFGHWRKHTHDKEWTWNWWGIPRYTRTNPNQLSQTQTLMFWSSPYKYKIVQVSSSRQGLELRRPQQLISWGSHDKSGWVPKPGWRLCRLTQSIQPILRKCFKAVGNSLMPPRRSHDAGTFVATLLQLWLPLGLHASQVDLSVFNKTMNMVTQE